MVDHYWEKGMPASVILPRLPYEAFKLPLAFWKLPQGFHFPVSVQPNIN